MSVREITKQAANSSVIVCTPDCNVTLQEVDSNSLLIVSRLSHVTCLDHQDITKQDIRRSLESTYTFTWICLKRAYCNHMPASYPSLAHCHHQLPVP